MGFPKSVSLNSDKDSLLAVDFFGERIGFPCHKKPEDGERDHNVEVVVRLTNEPTVTLILLAVPDGSVLA